MTACCRQLECSPRAFLPADILQVRNLRHPIAVGRRLERRRPVLAAQVSDDLGQMARRDRFDSGQRSLGRRVDGTHQVPEPCAARSLGSGEHAGHRSQPPVERQLSDRGMTGQPVRWELPRRGEDRECDGQVESRALLSQRRRCEVHGDPSHRPLELCRRDSTPNPMLGLLARPVREPHDREPGNPVLEVGLHLHLARLEAYEGMGDRPSEHIRRRYGSNTHVTVPISRRESASGRSGCPRRTLQPGGRSCGSRAAEAGPPASGPPARGCGERARAGRGRR